MIKLNNAHHEQAAEEARILALRVDTINAASKKDKSMISDIPIVSSDSLSISLIYNCLLNLFSSFMPLTH